MKILLLTVFCAILCLNALFSQTGINPDKEVIVSDSTTLSKISTHPDVFLSPLPDELNENSGIIFYRNKIWTHNDSGGEPAIFAVDSATGRIVQTIVLAQTKNVDWEDITQDDDYIYVGDFGNNRENRTDLKIYKIRKEDIPQDGDAEMEDYEMIRFTYADQNMTGKKVKGNNFDCEAMISFGQSLYLFSKNWGDQKTRVYQIPKIAGDYNIHPISGFEADGLVTAAAVSKDGNHLALLGYIDFESFMWLFWDFAGDDFFSGNLLRINFPDMVFVQTEGICFLPNNDILISCEESSEFPSVFSLNAIELKEMAVSKLGNNISDDIVLSGMPPEVSRRIKVDVLKVPGPSVIFELRNRRWEKVDQGGGVMKSDDKKMRINIRTKDLEDGLYFLKVSSGEYSIIRKVRVKN